MSPTRWMKTLALSIMFIAFFAASQGVAKADPVTFSTSGTFTSVGSGGSGAGTNSVTFTNTGPTAGTLTLTFNGSLPATLNTPTFFNAGEIVTSTTGDGAVITSPTELTIVINQTAPTAGTGNITGSLTGFVTQNQSTGVITFTVINSSTQIDGFTYTVRPSFDIVPPISGTPLGTTTIQGTITGGATPEPATMVLLGTGLVGVGAAMRRRRRQA